VGIRILDPACGSGSFLIGAHELLLQWHLDWYRSNDPERWAKGRTATLRRDHTNEWRSTRTERKRISLSNIFGVDIDAQAVEVTKLSLSFKVLEGENDETLASQLRLFRKRALPDLGSNIKCGNSLIDVDIYRDLLSELAAGDHAKTDANESDKLNAFEWSKEFPFLAAARGFDAIVGNPPWGADLSEAELEYLRQKHGRVVSRMIDSYIYFLDKAMLLTKPSVPIGMIVPGTILNQVDAAPLRQLLLDQGLSVVLNLGRGKS
jgi:Eco57I restriction-modification methylase